MKTTPAPELDDLIGRHLDETIDDAGRARLEAALRASPDAALRFARAVRMDERLHRHFHRRQALNFVLSRAGEARSTILRPSWVRSAREHAWAPVAAIALHAALILLLVRWVIVTPSPNTGNGVEITLGERPDRTPLDRRPVLPDEMHGPGLRVPEPSIAGPPPPEIEPPGAADLHVAFLPLDAGTAAAVADPARLAHPLVAGRFGAGRARSTALYGGTWSAPTEKTAARAVAWLARAQSPDGAWREAGTEDETLTSLVLLALMGHGETPVHGEHRTVVRAALQRLAASSSPPASPRSAALRLCALADAVALTRLPALQMLLDQAATAALDAERPGGGWDTSGPVADPLATAWTVEALRVASTAGVDDPRLAPAIRRAADALGDASIPTSGLLYYPAPARHGALAHADTAASLLALQLSGEAAETRIQRGLRALDAMAPTWPGRGEPDAAMEALYFATRVRYNEGGGGWMKWMTPLARSMTAAVSSAGSWPGAETGNGVTHPIRATALAVLILETPSRYPPASRWSGAAESAGWEALLARMGFRLPGPPIL